MFGLAYQKGECQSRGVHERGLRAVDAIKQRASRFQDTVTQLQSQLICISFRSGQNWA